MATNPSNAQAGYEGITGTGLLQECSSCGVLTVNANGVVVALTPLAHNLLEPGAQAAPSAKKLPPSILAVVHEAQKSRQPITDRNVVVPSGTTGRTLSVTVIPCSDPGSGHNVLVLLRDLSSTRKLELHLQRLDRLASIGTFSAGMAHEIKNALVPIKTFVGLILEKNPEADLAATARHEIDRVDSIVSRILRFAAPAKPVFAPVKVHELLDHSLNLVQHRTEGKNIRFNRQFRAASDAASGDDHQLEQAFVNLLLNAMEAMGPEGVVTASTDIVAREDLLPLAESGHVPELLRIDIADTGPGIAAENMAKIFEPFFTTKHSGTGLGLAVTRGIIEEHKGVIRVSSQAGKGTTFTVLLPTLG
jgi:signal transduction histidine kinase